MYDGINKLNIGNNKGSKRKLWYEFLEIKARLKLSGDSCILQESHEMPKSSRRQLVFTLCKCSR